VTDRPIDILLIEDNAGDARLMREMLAETEIPFNLEVAPRLETGLRHLGARRADLILLDLSLPDSEGLDTVGRVCDAAPYSPVIVLTGLDDEALAGRAVRKGAQDYLVKGQVGPPQVGRAIRYARERHAALAIQRHQSRMQAVGQLTGGIAHEFNNMLAVIIGNADLLLGNIADTDQHGQLESLLAAANRAAGLTRHLLAFCQIQPLQPRLVDAIATVRAIEPLVSVILDGLIGLRISAAPDLRLVLVDAGQLQTALVHLISNGRDASPTGSTIEITVENRTIDTHAGQQCGLVPGEYLAIAVRDHGVGMTPEVLERACEPFFTTKDVGKGTGLGLSMAYGFARQSGGNLEIVSQVGAGTTATLLLPANSEALGDGSSRSLDAAAREDLPLS